jgi:general secretion pathway protein J
MFKHLTRSRRIGGFTLIELLVAIGLMALMAALSWRGLDGMTRAQSQMRQHSDEVLALQAGLAQWGVDLDAIAPQPNHPSLDWDGRSLRILRRGMTNPGEGLTVVAWSRRVIDGSGQWLRWQSAPLTTRGELKLAWQEASQWAQNAGAQERKREVRLAPIDQWQIYYYRADAWSNPMSSEGASAAAPLAGAAVIPEGIRLVLTLTAGQAITGSVTRDWLRPSVGGGK